MNKTHADLTPVNYVAHDTLAVNAEERGGHTWRWLCLNDETKHAARAAVFASLAEHGLNELGATDLITEQVGNTAAFRAWCEGESTAAKGRTDENRK